MFHPSCGFVSLEVQNIAHVLLIESVLKYQMRDRITVNKYVNASFDDMFDARILV